MKGQQLATRMDGMQESATLALNARAKALQSEGKKIINLTAGELSSYTPDYIQDHVKTTLHQNKYTAVSGLIELKEALAIQSTSYYSLNWITPECVVVTAGAKPALYATFLALINPGDEVIVPIPAWVSYMHLIELVGGIVIPVPLSDTFDLDVDAIKKRLSPKTKAILINSPHNPTGVVFSKKSLQGLSRVLKDSTITVIADDIYSKLVYIDDFQLVPTFKFENIVIINGFSKSQALTGWRIGYVIAEPKTANAITQLLSHITGNASVQSQHAAIAALRRQDKPPAATMKLLLKQRAMTITSLRRAESISFVEPGGAFYFFIDIRRITHNSSAWCEALLQKFGVVLVPGEAFMAPGFARLTFSVNESVLEIGLQKIVEFTRLPYVEA